MQPMTTTVLRWVFLLALTVAGALAQERPGLLFREDFKETPAENPINQLHVANPDLTIHLYGPGRNQIKKSNHDRPADDPYYVWSGLAEGNWAVAFRHNNSLADLTGQAKIQWRAKQEGIRALHVIVKLADETWLVSDQSDGESRDWRVRDIVMADMTWRELDIDTVVEGRRVMRPDLARVEEIGFTDLRRGGGSRSCSRLDWIEVHANSVPRPTEGRLTSSR
jgi:hypothetical protein